MPLSNPFRRQTDRPSLRERAADLRSSVTNAIRNPKPETEPEQPAPTLEEFGQIDFDAHVFDFPVKAPEEWSGRFSEYGLAMHIADRTVRMTKPELMAFIRSEGEQDAEVPATIFRAIDAAGETFEGWGNLLKLARARYIVAASAELITPLASEDEASSAARAKVAAHPAASFQEQVEQAGRTGDVLASSGVDHRDGTVSYADATGKVVRRPMAHWIAFTAQQMHGRVQNEISRREVIEANHLPMADRIAWDDDIRCDLRSDAIHALTFRHLRAFEAARAIRNGSESSFPGERERDDAKLLALVPAWEAAADFCQQREDEQHAIEAAADGDNPPGDAPSGHGAEWSAWRAHVAEWRARTGVVAAEDALSEAGDALHQIELRAAELSAASFAGLKFKARIGQRLNDLQLDWPGNLSAGLARDIVALTDAAAKRAEAKPASFVEQIDFPASTLAELLAIRDVAKCVGDVASALTWGGRCHRRQNAHGAFEYNAAGLLVTAISDALTAVEVEAESEAKRRVPADADEQSTRLFMLAPGSVDNDDPDEIEALGREILAHAEALRTRA